MQIEPGLHVAEDCTIRSDNLPELDFDEVVEGVDMLLDESLNFEESWEKIPFVLELSDYSTSKRTPRRLTTLERVTFAVSIGSVSDFPW